MKRLIRTALAVVTLLCTAACARHTIIPDDELAQIFHDAFLTNAYIGSQNVRIDSLNIYEPIFARYGYTTEDVQYTIGNFSKRKSARLGDVVELAIDRLEEEGKRYDREVAILDTIDNVARRTFTRTVLSDSLIRVRSLRDTARLSFVVDVEPGEYRLTMKYLVDSLDRNDRVLRSRMWIERNDSTQAYPLYADAAPPPRGELYAHVPCRHLAPAAAPAPADLHRPFAQAAVGHGLRPAAHAHARDPHGRRQPLYQAT